MKRSGAKAIKDLNRANICFQSATTTEANLADYFRGQKMRFTSFAFDRAEDAKAAFLASRKLRADQTSEAPAREE